MELNTLDVLVLLKLVAVGDSPWTQSSLASDSCISQSQVHNSLLRAGAARLYSPISKCVLRQALGEFLVHGVKYAFPAMAYKAERGEWPGQAPLGYMNTRVAGRNIIVIEMDTALHIQRAFFLAENPAISLRKILSEVTEYGLLSKHGKPLGVTTLWNILTDPFYTGTFLYKGQYIQGRHQPLITKRSFDLVQKNLETRRRHKTKMPDATE